MTFTSCYQLVCAIAPHLTGFIPAEGDSEYSAQLVADPTGPPEGRLLVRATAGPRGRITVAGVFPRLSHYPIGNFRISVSAARAEQPERIAREIERRLLPSYIKALAEAITTRDSDRAEQVRCVADLRRLSDQGLLTAVSTSDSRYRGYLHNCGRMELHREGLASLEMSYVPQTFVEEILRRFVEAQKSS